MRRRHTVNVKIFDGTDNIVLERPEPDTGIFADFFTKRCDPHCEEFPLRNKAEKLLHDHRKRLAAGEKTHRIILVSDKPRRGDHDVTALRQPVPIDVANISDKAAIFLIALVLSEQEAILASHCTAVSLRRPTDDELRHRPPAGFVLAGRHIRRGEETELVLLTDKSGELSKPPRVSAGKVVNYLQVLLHELGHDATRYAKTSAGRLYDALKNYVPVRWRDSGDRRPMPFPALVGIYGHVHTVYSDARLRTAYPKLKKNGQFILIRAWEIAADLWMVRQSCQEVWNAIEAACPDIQSILASVEFESNDRRAKITTAESEMYPSLESESFFEFAGR